MWMFVICFAVIGTSAEYNFQDAVQRQYMKQGLPYRENYFLDNLPIEEEYDFVIIGSGPAGSVLANRLSAVPDWNVLLLEKGPESNIYSDIPFINPLTVLGNLTKMYEVERTDKACLELENGRCLWPAGEAVGGGSIINAMIHTRGHPTDFDGWAAEGNPGWSYNELLPYFKKNENITIPSLRGSPYHGNNGPVNIENPFLTKLGTRFLRAGQELGYKLIDYNNPNTMIGFSRTQATMKSGKRHSAPQAYLIPIKARKNFHVAKNTPAVKIIIDPVSKRARGVQFIRKGKERIVFAKKEVIISAGAFNSPKLLMLSGIGHRQHLEELGIACIQDLPVGDNLQEHLGIPTLNYFINSTESIVFPRLIRTFPNDFIQWLSGKGGILSNNAAEALGYIQTPLATNKADIEIIFLPITLSSDGGTMLRKTLNLSKQKFDTMWAGNYYRDGFILGLMVMYPRSRGTIRLRSKNVQDPPVIDGNFFDDPYDVKVLIEGIRMAKKLAETKAFQEIGAEPYTPPVQSCARLEYDSDEFWDCQIRAIPIQFHHQCGTNRMGPDPRTSVVDPRLRVHGIKGLRVVDTSIIPQMPGTHTMAPAYVIGEKGTDLIKEDWGVLN